MLTVALPNPYFISAMFQTCFFSPVLSFNDEKVSYKYYKRITTRCIGYIQSHDQEESKLNSTINVNCGAQALAQKIFIHPHQKRC